MIKKHLFWMQFLAAVVLLTNISLAFSGEKENHWPDFYDRVQAIKIKDPMALLVGSLPEKQNVLTIHLMDVALYTGHVCPGVASAYVLTRMALKALYLDEIPERGQIRVAAMAPSDLMDVASYITGARSFYGRDEINAEDLVIDKSLDSGQPGVYVMVFQRKDNGKAVKAIFNKFSLISPRQAKGMKVFLQRMLKGKVSQKEKEQQWAKIQAVVKKVLLNPPEGVFNILPLKEYNFPVNAEKLP